AFGVLMLEAQRDGRKLSLRLFQGDVWLQAADRKETQAGAGQSSVDSIRRTPDVTLIRKVKSRREDTHDGQLLIGDPNPLPQNGIASAEMSLPIGIADQRRSGIAGFLLLRTENAAKNGRYGKRLKKFRRDSCHVYILRG